MEDTFRPLAITAELHVVVEHEVGKQRLELVRREETTRTTVQASAPKSAELGNEQLPCVLAMSERKIFRACMNELVLCVRVILFTQAREAEGVEHVWVGVDRFVVVPGVSGGDDDGALGDECSVIERQVDHRLTSHGR